MPSLTIRLPDHAAAALNDLAEIECRSPKEQAAFLILEGLRAVSPPAPTLAAPTRRSARIKAEPRPLGPDSENGQALGSIGA